MERGDERHHIDNLPKPGTVFFFEDIIIPLIPFFVSVLISILVLLWLRSQELTVTDKRVYGNATVCNNCFGIIHKPQKAFNNSFFTDAF